MNYEIKLPAIAGDIIPISAVARAMALRDATAGGPGGLRATYDGRCASYEAMLLKHVCSDSLAVCDDVGDCGKADDIVARRIADGSGVALLPDSRQVDEDTTWLMNLFVKLVHLNDWASRRGDAFTVSHEGVSWVEAAHHVTRDGVSHFDVRHRGASDGVTPAETVPETDEPPPLDDHSALATRKELITAFGAFTGMDMKWFDNLTDTPALLAARKVDGVGSRGSTREPLFCPWEVMLWLASPKRKKGRKFNNADKPWELLERHFAAAYTKHSRDDPRTE